MRPPGMCVFSRRASWFLAAALMCPGLSCAQGADQAPVKMLDGYLGAGALYAPRYAGGAGYETKPIPLAMIEYKETAYVHFDRAGVRLWSSRDKTMALGIAAQPRFGFHARDGERLTGMATRRDAIEGGAAFEWQQPSWALSAAWFTDWSSASGGQSFDLSVERDLLERGPWDVSAYLDLDYADAKIIRYYFGVRPDEATGTRPSYQPGAALTSSLGFSGAYRLNKRYALLFGSELSHLGAAAAGSPIVQRRSGVTTYLGLGLAF
jgi:outer membrane protein